VIAAIYRLYTLKQFDETRFERAKDKTLYKTLISYSGWHLFGSLSGIAQNQGVSIILNMFFGPVVNAAQGIANQVMSAVNGFVGNFQMAVNPQIIKSFAEGDNNYMISLIIRGAKFSFYLLFILSLPILLEVDQILKLWLKTVPNYASTFTSLTLIVVLIDSISGSLMTAVQATGNIKVWNLVIGIFKILGLPFTYFLLRLGYPPEISLYILITFQLFHCFFDCIFYINW
jgi:O-antigen/teichoic acid export membrane protein